MTAITPPGARAGGRRFWFTVLLFALLNAATWVGYHQWSQSRLHLLRVEKFEPGPGSQVGSRPVFSWHFNLDVAPGTADAPPPGIVTPAITGQWQWSSPRTLTFTPASDLPAATRFTLSLNTDRLRTPEGARLAKSFSETVQTAPLELRDIRQAAFDERDRLVLELDFNDQVVPADVVSHLQIKDADGRPIAFKPHGEAAGTTVRVLTDPVPVLTRRVNEAWVMVDLSAGLAGSAGPLPMPHPVSRRLTVSTSLAATGLQAYMPSSANCSLRVALNNRVDLETVRAVISVEPAIPFTLSENHSYGSELCLRGDFKSGQRYVVKIGPPPAGVDPKKLPRPTTLSVLVPDREPGVWFKHSEGYVGTGGNRTLAATAVNLYEFKAVVTRVYDDNLVAWRNAGGDHGRSLTADFGRPIATRRIELRKEKNKVQEIQLSLDELLPPDAPRDGVYRIALLDDSGNTAPVRGRHGRTVPASLDSDADAADDSTGEPYLTTHCLVTLSDIGLSARQSKDGLLVWAVSLSTGKPLGGVRVRVYSNKNQPMGEAVTDADGLARVATVPPPAGERAAVVLAEIPQQDRIADAGATPAAARSTPPRGLTWLELRGGEINTAHFDIGGRPFLRQGFEAFLYTDRGIYRPGEKVYLRGIVRGADQSTPQPFPVRWQLRRPDLRNWKSQTVTLDADGGALLEVNLPSDVPTGRWSADLAIPGENGKPERSFGSISFQVEEFMPNRMKVAFTVAGALPGSKLPQRVSLNDGPLDAQVQADYLFGRPVTELPATLAARVEPVAFTAEKWAGWTFGDSASVVTALGGRPPVGGRIEVDPETLDAKGHATWELDADSLVPGQSTDPDAAPIRVKPARRSQRAKGPLVAAHVEAPAADGRPYNGPWRVTFVASVCEAGGRAVNAFRTVDIDLVPYYVAVRARSAGATPHTPAVFDLNLVSPGGLLAGAEETQLAVTLYRESWNTSLVESSGRYHYDSTLKLEPVGETQKIDLAGGHDIVTVTPPASGSYTLVVRDARTGGVTTHRFYASQGAWEENVSREDPEKLEIILLPEPLDGISAVRARMALLESRSAAQLWHQGIALPAPATKGDLKFRPGERARVIVRSPFAGELLLTVETDHVVSSRVIPMGGSHVSVPVEIPADCRPNGYITATVVRAIDPNAKWQSHRAYGIVPVSLDNTDRKLTVQVASPTEVRPGNTLGIELRVTDSSGQPARNAAVTVSAVDEGILTLTSFRTPDPFAFFTSKRALGVGWADVYGALMPEVTSPGRSSEVGGDGDGPPGGTHQTPVSAKRVRPVSLVSGVLHTDAAGIARADFPVPEFGGQLRVMAVTYGDRATGSNEGRVFVRSPVMVQSSWPRFAAPTDSFSVPLVVFNNTPAKGLAQVTLQLLNDDGHPNPLAFRDEKGSQLALSPIEILPGGQGRLSLQIVARSAVGVARVRLVAKLNGETFQETVELPVRPASPFVTTGGYLAVKTGSPTTLPAPPEMLEGTGELQVRMSARPTLELPRGLEYLERYPYGCAEQTISTSFPLIALGDLGKEIAPGVFEPARVKEKLDIGITRLIGMQTSDGGIAMWPGERHPWPWVSVYAAHFVVEAQAAGHHVPEDFRDHLFTYVRTLLNRSEDGGDGLEQQAYACYVLAMAGKPERTVMSRLSEVVNHPSPPSPDHFGVTSQTRFHLAAAWLAAGRRDLAGGLVPQTLPQPRSDRQLSGNVGSPVRERAIVVSALLSIDPDHPALPTMVQQLAAAGSTRQWSSTQDAAFAVMAIGKYLRQTKQSAGFNSARLLRDGLAVAGSESGQPLVWNSKVAGGPMIAVATGSNGGKAHLSWLQNGVPLKPPADSDSAMTVRRRYLDRAGKPLTDSVHSGDLIQIELTISSLTPLDNLVIDDLLPAGLEIENARLETAATLDEVIDRPQGKAPAIPALGDSRVDIRDDRLILCGRLPTAGSARYTYLARAVSPGVYVVPPVHAECMYDIGINSLWGGGKTLTVLAVGKEPIASAVTPRVVGGTASQLVKAVGVKPLAQ